MTRKEYQKLSVKAENGTLHDNQNPIFILSNVSNKLLTQIIKGKINLQELAKREMENRGRDIDGEWVGFSHNIK